MSDKTPSRLIRSIPVIAGIMLSIMVIAAAIHVLRLKPEPVAGFEVSAVPPAPDYSSADAWLVYPDAEPAGGWITPWGVDLFWIPDGGNGFVEGWNAPYDSPIAIDLPDISTPESSAVQHAGYVPTRRYEMMPDETIESFEAAQDLALTDVTSAARYYLSSANKQRGMFLGAGSLRAAALVSRLLDREPDLFSAFPYFGGVILSDPELLPQIDLPECVEQAPVFPCVFVTGMATDGTGKTAGALMASYSEWLDTNVRKPAAPLPALEVIEVAPVRRPGSAQD